MPHSSKSILAIDQGTTSSRAILFSQSGDLIAQQNQEFEQLFPHDGWVEHRPEDIWQSTISMARAMMAKSAALDMPPFGIGITNQRETVVIWDRKTGEPIYNAIVWQDRRTAAICESLDKDGKLETVNAASGLLLDPYFSATKVAWILDHVTGARARAERGELCFGTIDSFLIWRLTGGKKHVTDATNASRTNLYNIEKGGWDETLCAIFNVPMALLPEVQDCASHFGDTDKDLLGVSLPILGVAGDQQAATIGQACFTAGDIKSTYGTGCFMLANTGKTRLYSKHKLLSTVAYQIDGTTTFGLEGSIFISGAIIQWLRDGLRILEEASQSEGLASSLGSNDGVYMVPALTGLGAPHWAPHARGAVYGITRDTGPAHFARAALESVAYQTHDLIKAIEGDGMTCATVKVDGGMVANNWLMQFMSDVIDCRIERPVVTETTALGVAMLAMLQDGQVSHLDDMAKLWQLEERFEPSMADERRQALLAGWQKAVMRTLS
ncbi:MAG: glycerol kinase GlpK [Candidatus Puniceispirillaceae bacterium]